jgi:hypothetical protein
MMALLSAAGRQAEALAADSPRKNLTLPRLACLERRHDCEGERE